MGKMTYPELQKEAAKRDINPVGKTKIQLQELLGITAEGDVVIDESLALSEVQKKDMKEKRIEVPRPVIMAQDQAEIIRKFMERNPGSFSGYNFKNREQRIIITFTKDAECICGNNFRMSAPDERTRQDPPTFPNMCTCGRKWIYIDPDLKVETL